MTLRQLLSGEYCPYTGIKIKVLNTVSTARSADKPPGYYYLQNDQEQPAAATAEGQKKQKNIQDQPKIKARTNRANYFRQWYLDHKQHKHDQYIQRKQKNHLIQDPDANNN